MTASNLGRHAVGFLIGTVLGTAFYCYRNPEEMQRETGLQIRWRRAPVHWASQPAAQVPQAAASAVQPPERWTDPGQSA
ncbi:hypothetical protein COHA_005750 [Chlorella ohadii]|uniref:Uncharacterized protein n=1 Tax=Chlorella ohadii TaxID=2649997 RepID=A0AAD5DRC6_9CHLO|nr:hypothetical protein COHA_005750 [Chlorella ohadii]